MDEVKQCVNLGELKSVVNNLKEDTYYYFVYFDDIKPFCVIRKFKNATWLNGLYCSIYDADSRMIITLLANSPYDLVKNKDYIHVKFSSGYAGVFYITRSLQTAHNVLRKECRKRKFNAKFYKDCMKKLKEFATNPSLKETVSRAGSY